MRRRKFIALVGSVAVAKPIAARAQQPDRMRRIGVMMAYVEGEPEGQLFVGAFREELRKLGWVEGRNVQIDYRWTAGDAALRQRFAKEMISQQPDVILSNNTPTTVALTEQTHTIPIVFALVMDPIGNRFVADLPRPGGNVTGFTAMEMTIASKWLELLKEIAPAIKRVLVLFNPATAPYADILLATLKTADPSLDADVIAAPVHDISELNTTVSAQASRSDVGLIALPDTFTTSHHVEIISLAERNRIPSIYPYPFFTKAGGLLSYGIDIADNFRRAAIYVDRILRGTNLTDLPVQTPVKYITTVNLTTAKALGLAVPTSILLRADEVIE
jgi:putative tryptophan/tyrosine transport system substrate-binding protein